MKIFKICVAVFFFTCFWASISSADIYSWKDDNGIMHFTNYCPPPEARIMVKDVEIPVNTDPEIQSEEPPELLRTQPERVGEALEEVKNLVEDLENRLTEANRRAEEVMENAEASGEEPYYSASYDSSDGSRYLYLGGVKWRYRPGFYHKRPHSKPTIWDIDRLHQKRHYGKSHLKKDSTLLRHKRLYSKPTIWDKSRVHQNRYYRKSHVGMPRSGFNVKAHIGRGYSAFNAKVRSGGRGSAFGGKGRSER